MKVYATESKFRGVSYWTNVKPDNSKFVHVANVDRNNYKINGRALCGRAISKRFDRSDVRTADVTELVTCPDCELAIWKRKNGILN
jgi:hypothetical protein